MNVLVYITFVIIILFFNQVMKTNNKNNENDKSYQNIVLIRFHSPSSSQIERFKLWEKTRSEDSKYIYLTDVKYDNLDNLTDIYYISAEEVLKHYPSIAHTGMCVNKEKNWYVYTFHLEHIMLCVISLLKKYKFNYIWVLEEDIGFSGDMNMFIKKYDKIKSDLITTKYDQTNYYWYKCCTNEYMKLRISTIGEKTYKTSEHIQRFSKKYFQDVNKLLNNNIHSFSEHSSIEFCIFLNLTYHNIDENDIGYKFDWNTRLSKEEWNGIMKNTQYKNKLYHSLKF